MTVTLGPLVVDAVEPRALERFWALRPGPLPSAPTVDRPEELAAWWAGQVGAEVRNGPDGTPRWLYGSAGWEGLIWKFVRVDDERVVPNRWQWTVLPTPLTMA